MLSICYFTSRKRPRIEWFFASLARETGGDYTAIRVVVVDFWAKQRGMGRRDSEEFETLGTVEDMNIEAGGGEFFHVPPKPCVWQGPHRLTKEDYFAASNARNTAIALAPDGWIAFVDDLSVLLPGWLKAVREAQQGGYIALGAYKKVKQLRVNADASEILFEPFPGGVDSRWDKGSDEHPVEAAGSWLFGCSLAAPVEAFLNINGFDEDNDSMGGEDYAAGMMLERQGWRFRYARSMATYESEEEHAQLPVFKRVIKIHRGAGPACPDASHWMLQAVMKNRFKAPNYFGEAGLRGLRARVLTGEPFPIAQIPQHHWPDSQPLCEM